MNFMHLLRKQHNLICWDILDDKVVVLSCIFAVSYDHNANLLDFVVLILGSLAYKMKMRWHHFQCKCLLCEHLFKLKILYL